MSKIEKIKEMDLVSVDNARIKQVIVWMVIKSSYRLSILGLMIH